MTRVIRATLTEASPEADGRRWVHERHECDDGQVLTASYLARPETLVLDVLQARSAEYNRQFELRDEASGIVAGSKIPLTHLEFLSLFPPAPAGRILRLHATIWEYPGLTDEMREQINLGWEKFRMASFIRRPFDQQVVAMIALYRQLGLLTQAEAEAVLAAG